VNRIKSTLARLGIRDFKPLSPRSIAEEDAKRPNRERECLVGDVGTRAMPAMAPFPTQPPQEPPLEQFGVQPICLCPAMFPRNRHTRGMDHVCLYPARLEPARQPKAVAAGFEGQRNPRDCAAGPDRLIPPAMQHRKQPSPRATVRARPR
jgi:hypothetical protein